MTTRVDPAANTVRLGAKAREVRAPRGSEISCRGWQQ